MEAIKTSGAAILGVTVFVAMIFVAVLLIEGTATVAGQVLPFLISATNIGTVFCIVFLLPLLLFRATRIFSIWGLFIASYLFGLGVWMYGFLVTYDLWGGGGVFIGLVLGYRSARDHCRCAERTVVHSRRSRLRDRADLWRAGLCVVFGGKG
jgi:hypothetical protein